jgi:hypothetical protein
VLGSPADITADGLCLEFLSADRPTDQRVLSIAYNRRPSTLVEAWEAEHGALPAEMAIVCPESQAEPDADRPADVYETHVAAGDLTGVSIAVSRYVDRWEGDDRAVHACLDSLTAMLQYTDADRVFRFLHTVTGRCMATGATLHVHLDPDTQDDQTVATLATLFDVVVRREGDEWAVRQA